MYRSKEKKNKYTKEDEEIFVVVYGIRFVYLR